MKKGFVDISYGEKSERVADAQRFLQKAGSKIQVNGEFTIGMVTAVKTFQKKNGLKVTGIIDEKTMVALVAVGKSARKKK